MPRVEIFLISSSSFLGVVGRKMAGAQRTMSSCNTHWNGHDSRAVVPTESMKSCRDVLLGSPLYTSSSPSALALGVYAVVNFTDDDSTNIGFQCDLTADDDDASADSMPLFYVSKQVAEDRSRCGIPVTPGWYLVATPGQSFEVRVTPTAGELTVNRTAPTAAALIANVLVDGVDASPGGSAYSPDTLGYETRIRGFVEHMARDASGGSLIMRQFIFRKASLTDCAASSKVSPVKQEDSEGAISTIKLVVSTAILGEANVTEEHGSYVMKQATPVDEKAALKSGTSLGVDREGQRIVTTTRSFHYKVVGRKVLPHLEVVVHVRERFWMETRRLVDRFGKPCTADMALKVACSTKVAVPRGVIELDNEPSPPKRPRIVGGNNGPSCEVIDLT